MRVVIGFLISTLLSALFLSPVQAADLPPEVRAVQKYVLEKDYPEYFEQSYTMRIDNALIGDLDGDGTLEVVLQTWPHFRQSAPLTIFNVSPNFTVTRVIEGLAPGPLVPISGDYLDSHSLGRATDVDLGDKQSDLKTRENLISHFLSQGASVVAYSTFFHTDVRENGSYFIDMSHIANPGAKTCNDFEFSRVKGATIGTVAGLGDGNILASWAGTQIYLYRINAFLPSGRLDKTHWELEVPANFEGFAPSQGGPVKLVVGGKSRPLVVSCTDATATCRAQD